MAHVGGPRGVNEKRRERDGGGERSRQSLEVTTGVMRRHVEICRHVMTSQ